MIIKKTKNYEQFKIMEWNRAVSTSRVSAIKESIEMYGYIPNPIIVNEKLEVIDGQGRLQACSELGIPIYYIVVEGIGGTECIAMNCYQKQWTTRDYIDYYAKRGNSHYIKLQKLISENEGVSLNVILRALHSPETKTIRKGEFTLEDADYNQARAKLRYIHQIQEVVKHNVSRSIASIIISLVDYRLISKSRLLEQISKYSFNYRVSNSEDALEEVQRIYNYRKKEKAFFKDAYYVAVNQ